MSFEDLKSAVAARAGLSKAQTDQALAAFFEQLKTSLGQGDNVSLPGVGQFEVAERAARQGRNPQTGETIDIPASKAVKFKAGKALKDAVNG
ncbi:MAG: HU family DNA-binding protein [Geminicoccaceae bacterium]